MKNRLRINTFWSSFLIIVLMSGIPARLFSQTKNLKLILDAKTRLPVDYVYVSSDNNKINLMSTKEGKLILTSDSNTRSFTFYKMGYDPKTIGQKELQRLDTILLNSRPLLLEEVVVKPKTLEAIVKDKRYYVDDYVLLPNNDFLLLTSKINIHACEIAYFKRGRGITCKRTIVKEKEEHLFSDCFKNIHLVTDQFSRQIFFPTDSTFDFLSRYSRSKFDSTLALCALKIDTQVIMKICPPTFTVKAEYFDYAVNASSLHYLRVSGKKREPFYSVYFNKQIMEMLENEISDEAIKKTQIKMIGGHNESDYAYASQRELFFSKVAKPIYAPIFLKQDTVIIFNFQENTIVFTDKAGHLLKEVEIKNKEISTFRSFEILFDPVKQDFYFRTKELDRSILALWDIHTGSIRKTIHLEKVFAKNIQVFNGRIYYLVREKDWDDTCYLYQQNE